MKFALVFNPFKYKLHEENLKIVQKYFGLFPPLSLTWPAAIAEQHGHQVILIDARTLGLTKEEVLDRLIQFQPDIMGFMMTTYMYRETLEWIVYFKKRLKIPVVIGGYNLRVYPKESIMPGEIDFGVVNSSLYTIPELFKQLESERRFDDVPGLVYKEKGEIIQTPSLKPEERFEDYPNPARHLLPNELYAEFPTERRNFTAMVTSKGCPMRCKFCEAGRTYYNPRSAKKVVDEIQECYYKYNIKEIDIFDYEFLIDRKRALDICKRLQEKKMDITWACRSRIDSVDEKLLQEMKNAGCCRIYYGVESGNQNTLDELNKGITVKQIKDNIRLTKEIGIKTLGFILIGVPGETKQTIKNNLRFAKSLDLDYVQFSKLTAKPLTDMWKQLVKDTNYDYWKEYILGNTVERPLPRPWTKLSNKEIDELTKRCYISYYFRPLFLLKAVLEIKSFKEFKRKFFAFWDMLFKQENVSKVDGKFEAFNENKFF